MLCRRVVYGPPTEISVPFSRLPRRSLRAKPGALKDAPTTRPLCGARVSRAGRVGGSFLWERGCLLSVIPTEGPLGPSGGIYGLGRGAMTSPSIDPSTHPLRSFARDDIFVGRASRVPGGRAA